MAERAEISSHEVKFYRSVVDADRWQTASDLATASGVASRTARAFALKFVRLGLLDQAEVWPAHRYRWSALASKRNKAYVQRLTQAESVFAE